MTTQHTPGPWRVAEEPSKDRNSSRTRVYVVRAEQTPFGTRPAVATVGTSLHDYETEEANARLIAAAPDLLAALRALTATARTFRNVPQDEQEWTPLDDEALDASFAAIAKALGS